jgi:hypothetical protein
MLRNLGDAVQAVVDRHHAGVWRVAEEIAGEAAAEEAAIPLNPINTAKLTSAEQRSQDAYARRQARYDEAAELKTAGVPIKRIAASIGVERGSRLATDRWSPALAQTASALRSCALPGSSGPPLDRRLPQRGPTLARTDRAWLLWPTRHRASVGGTAAQG